MHRMGMSRPTDRELTRDVARQAIAHLAPDELTLFDAASDQYFNKPSRVHRGRAGLDEPLSFGIDQAAVLLTPLALAVATDVVNAARDELANGLVGWIRRRMISWFRRRGRKPRTAVQPLTADQAAYLRKVAAETATSLG